MSFLTLRDLMLAIGYSSTTAWIFPAIIDTAVAVSTMMLVALGDKPARRTRTASTPAIAEVAAARRGVTASMRGAKTEFKPVLSPDRHPSAVHDTVQTETAVTDADLAADLIALRVTTQPIETVIAVLAARREGASINAAAKASGINYRTAQRIVDAAEGRRQGDLLTAS
jgi:hypothetical protein